MTDACPKAEASLLKGEMSDVLSREWLITNNLGGYSSSTVLNCNTRRYHGLLVAANLPPVGRIVTVNNFLERLIVEGREYEISNFEFNGKIHPAGFQYQTSFQLDIDEDLSSVSFVYKVDDITFIRTLWLFSDYNTALIYWLAIDENGARNIKLAAHPLVSLRDFHSLRRQSAQNIFDTTQTENSLHIQVPSFASDTFNSSYDIHLHPMGLRGPVDAEFIPRPDWWYNFRYRVEAQRGQDCGEDLYMPGFFEVAGQGRTGFGLWLDTHGLNKRQLDKLLTRVNTRLQSVHSPLTLIDEVSSPLAPDAMSNTDNPLHEPVETTLRKAANQFIVQRKDASRKKRWTILAGFPWFGDWGRDAFQSLPGLLLDTGRYEQAYEVLLAFGSAISQDGLIPNRFDDYDNTPSYNSVDASLWYIYAADEYILASGDDNAWKKHLQKICLKIVDNFIAGTQFDIKVDPEDGLLWAGNEETQITWMDARCGNVVFTPRWGKPVEVNALWYNALCILINRLDGRKSKKIRELKQLRDLAAENFRQKFWNSDGNYLYDCIRNDYCDPTIRPNQIFAVSLRESPLRIDQQKSVVESVRKNLLTPFGLRSLAPSDPNYHGVYIGNQFQRDRAYHRGTVWGFLIGPFIEAYLRVNDYSLSAAATAQEYLKPILEKHLYDACIGNISEIFDGNEPHNPRGCIAQAWSVAQTIRAELAIKKVMKQEIPAVTEETQSPAI